MFSHEYRKEAMKQFREGHIRILVCTDAAGMGCNISDIDMVVQWKLPEKFSSFLQRAGRAARGAGRDGVAVLLAEPSAYSVDTSCETGEGSTSSAPQKRQGGVNGKKASEFGELHGRYRGQRDGARDEIPHSLADSVHIQDSTEGMHAFVQTSKCRRAVQHAIFSNPPSTSTVPCCDICCPSLLDLVRPGIKPKAKRNPKLPEIKPNSSLVSSLHEWREKIHKRDIQSTFLTPSTILPDEAVSILASLSTISKKSLQAHLQKRWRYWETYGDELSEHFLVASETASMNVLLDSDTTDSTLQSTAPNGSRSEVHSSTLRASCNEDSETMSGACTGRENPRDAPYQNGTVTVPEPLQAPHAASSAKGPEAGSVLPLRQSDNTCTSQATQRPKKRQRLGVESVDTQNDSDAQMSLAPPPSRVIGFQMVTADHIVQSSYQNPSLETAGAVPDLHFSNTGLIANQTHTPTPSQWTDPMSSASGSQATGANAGITPQAGHAIPMAPQQNLEYQDPYFLPNMQSQPGQFFNSEPLPAATFNVPQVPVTNSASQNHVHDSQPVVNKRRRATKARVYSSFRGFVPYNGPP
ncbi:hypothetical protein SCHPADRAFT_891083 [Schizopora paradoxa]|uniref:Helicase C-terminal domain-containing protein n=1 Tax=Schizopora paradoxa TaxID=27342 RepID=A0A0H2RJK6_9AGAM|nr:hypothetical protein SCHPADRAFT_891083 [Schizopora paradoxa]